MKASELRDKNHEELDTILKDLVREQFNLRMQGATGQESRPSQIKKVRHDIARVKTVVNEQKAGASE